MCRVIWPAGTLRWSDRYSHARRILQTPICACLMYNNTIKQQHGNHRLHLAHGAVSASAISMSPPSNYTAHLTSSKMF
jgi:hypothetical protein